MYKRQGLSCGRCRGRLRGNRIGCRLPEAHVGNGRTSALEALGPPVMTIVRTANLRPERTPEDGLRAGDGEEDPELGTAELDKSIIYDAFTEYWRTLSRAKQDDLSKEWNLKYPEGGCPYDQYILAWFARQDPRKKERTQEAEAGCRVAQEREDEAAASGAPHRR